MSNNPAKINLRHRLASREDGAALARLNEELIRDEGHRNSMTISELTDRMKGWLAEDYQACLFEDESGLLAYALYREEKALLHLRQFFVQRHKRRLGIGRQCMQILFSKIWPRDKRIIVEVLSQNTAGIAFWREVGFDDYSLSLEIYPNLETLPAGAPFRGAP